MGLRLVVCPFKLLAKGGAGGFHRSNADVYGKSYADNTNTQAVPGEHGQERWMQWEGRGWRFWWSLHPGLAIGAFLDEYKGAQLQSAAYWLSASPSACPHGVGKA